MTVEGSVESSAQARSTALRFSYVICAGHEPAVLVRAVERAAASLQRFEGSEILIVANGSVDEIREVSTELAARPWGPVAVRPLISTDRLNRSNQMATQCARGDYVVFPSAGSSLDVPSLESFSALPTPTPRFAVASSPHGGSLPMRALRRALIGPIGAEPDGPLIIEAELARRLIGYAHEDGALLGTELVALARAENVVAVEIPVDRDDECRSVRTRVARDGAQTLFGLMRVRRRLDAYTSRVSDPPPVEPSAVLSFAPRPWLAAAALPFLAVLGLVALVGGVLAVPRAINRVAQGLSRAPTTSTFVVAGIITLLACAVAGACGIAVTRAMGQRSRHGRWRSCVVVAPSRKRGTVPRLGRPWLWATIAAPAAAVVVLMWRVLGHLSGSSVGSGDARYWYWLGWRLAEQVRHGDLLPLRLDSVVSPIGYNLRISDGLLPAAAAAFWNLITGSPTLAFNLATMTALATTCWAGMRVARSLGATALVAATAGFVLATVPALAIRLEGHYNLLFAFPAILLVDIGVRHVVGKTQVFPVARTVLLLVLAYLSSGYFFVGGLLALGLIVLAGELGLRRTAEAMLRLGIAVALALLVLSPALIPKGRFERAERAAGVTPMTSGAAFYSSDATAVFVPPKGALLHVSRVESVNKHYGANILETTAFAGWAGLLGLGALLFLRSPVKRSLLVATGALWVLSLGPTLTLEGWAIGEGLGWLPMTAVLHLPGFDGVRAPNRFSFLVAILAITSAVVALEFVRRRAPRATTAVACGVCAALAFASLRVPINRASPPDASLATALDDIARDAAPGKVLHLPADCMASIPEIEYQIFYKRDSVGCQGMQAAMPWGTEFGTYTSSSAWAALRCDPTHIGSAGAPFPPDVPPTPDAVRRLRTELGVGFVVFDRTASCDRSHVILAALLAESDVLGGDDTHIVLRIRSS